MGRKRNQGKARRAAKGNKAREGDTSAYLSERSLFSEQMRQVQIGDKKCTHGFDPFISTELLRFISAFRESFNEAAESGGQLLSDCLLDACSATLNEYAEVWKDLAKLEVAMSYFLFMGTQQYLDGKCTTAQESAAIARLFEQHIAVYLKQSQALPNSPKIDETFYSDKHTLVKFFSHRVSCSCLDEKYEEVKSITKMGICYNTHCKMPTVERSKAKCCSRCRCATYCSRECQEADWSRHKPICDTNVSMINKFEARQHNT